MSHPLHFIAIMLFVHVWMLGIAQVFNWTLLVIKWPNLQNKANSMTNFKVLWKKSYIDGNLNCNARPILLFSSFYFALIYSEFKS
jgi:hypothetical protein